MKGKMESKDEMADIIAERLREGYVFDLKKKDFDHFERAAVIRQVLDDKGWSIRAMAREYNIPRSTIEDWLLYNRIEQEEYGRLISEGYSHTQIYHTLRNNKSNKSSRPVVSERLTDLDVYLNGLHREVGKYKRNLAYSARSRELIDVVINDLRELKSNINIAEKKCNAVSKAK